MLLLGMKFAHGATMVITKEQLRGVGGFSRLADYLADDFLLGNYVAAEGFEVVLSDYVVEHISGPETFAGMLRHQLRWGRSTRISRCGRTRQATRRSAMCAASKAPIPWSRSSELAGAVKSWLPVLAGGT